MSRILVTGASGFIGRAAVAAFAREGHAVRAAVRRPPAEPFDAEVETVVHTDLTQQVDWTPVVAGCDAVVHLAGIAHSRLGTPQSLYDRVNRAATAELAAAAAQAGVGRFVFVSSIRAQSGAAADHAISERDPARPTNPYGRSKLAAEDAVRAAGVPFTILRPALVYGVGVKGNFALLLRAASSRWPLPVRDFSNRRSMLALENLLSAMNFVLSAPATAGETYVVADPGIALRLSDIISTLREAQGRRAFVIPLPSQYLEIPLRIVRARGVWERFGGNLRVDSSKLLAAGWHPPLDTRHGLSAIAQAASPRKSGTASRSTR
jgi:UDP-glucose 4-epimerase